MSERAWFLEMSMVGPHGERYTQRVNLDDRTAREFQKINPPGRFDFVSNTSPFDAAIEVLKRRELRKDLFVEAASRLGAQLAERMEDAEGWHDISRVEPAKLQLKG